MNSLQELNGYVQGLSFEYEDLRLANVLFNLNTPVNQTQFKDEGFTFLSSVGIDIIEVINYASSQPAYVIDISAVSGATISWTSLPDGVVLTTPSTGIYRLSGLKSNQDWDAVKYATINLPTNYFGVFTYTSKIEYFSGISGNQIKSWTTAVTINDITFLTNPVDFAYPVNQTATIPNTPQIINLDIAYPAAVWTVVATPSITSSITDFLTSGTGGTFSVNSTTKVITIIGTRAQINSRLAGLQLVSNSNTVDFTLTFYLTNNLNSSTDTKIQLLKNQQLQILGNVTVPTIYFAEDADYIAVLGPPIITDSAYDGTGTYTYTITPSTTAAITLLEDEGDLGTSSFNSTTKVLTLTGTRSQINYRLSSLKLTTSPDWSAPFTLSYFVNTPRNQTAIKLQVFACNTTDNEISNMALSRNYISNNANLLFATNTPQIVDLDTNISAIYTLILSSAPGQWSIPSGPLVSTLTYSGTRNECNAIFNQIKFYPNPGISSNSTFTYSQKKDGIDQISQTATLIGSSGTFTGSNITFSTGQIWSPAYDQYLYGQFDILVVGAGGGGGKNAGGGGGGGAVNYQTGLTFANSPYTVTIGLGGAADTIGSYDGIPRTGVSGGNSSFGNISASGGLGGGSGIYSTNNPRRAGKGGNGGNGSAGGLANYYGSTYFGGGGGGAGGAGETAGGSIDPLLVVGGAPADGGAGAAYDIFNTGTPYYYAGGGGGGGDDSGYGSGQSQGPRSGANGGDTNTPAGVATNGGGGGGGGSNIVVGSLGSTTGSAGGNGIIRVKIYPK